MAEPTSKNIAVVLTRPPYGSSLAREAIDLALAAAVYNQQVSLYFIGDGVWQLLAQQHTDKLAAKNHGKLLDSLELYGIENIFIEQQALAARDIGSEDIAPLGEIISQQQIAVRIADAETVLNF